MTEDISRDEDDFIDGLDILVVILRHAVLSCSPYLYEKPWTDEDL